MDGSKPNYTFIMNKSKPKFVLPMLINLIVFACLSLQLSCSEDLDDTLTEGTEMVDTPENTDGDADSQDTENDGDGEGSGTGSGSNDGNGDAPDDNNGDENQEPCSGDSDKVFQEKDGLLVVEFEDAKFADDWKLKNDGEGFSGKGYMVWEGEQHLGNPGNGKVSFNIKISEAGTYSFLWKSAVKMGDNGTEHNDTWLRFADADDFYAKKGESIVYPKDIGKTPNPEGASKDGWFKIYRSGQDLDFKWQARTFDNDAHDIFVVFDSPGTYTMEVSARSSGHGIDKFVLFSEAYDKNAAISDANPLSTTSCD